MQYNGDASQVRMVVVDLRAPVGFSFEPDDIGLLDEYIESLDRGLQVIFDYRLRADKVIEGVIQDVAVWDNPFLPRFL